LPGLPDGKRFVMAYSFHTAGRDADIARGVRIPPDLAGYRKAELTTMQHDMPRSRHLE